MSNTLPDTGARTVFETGAIRDASVGKGLPSRIPPAALRRLAKRYEDGEAKYPDRDGIPNWQRGMNLSRFFDSAFRHLLAAAEGDTSEDHHAAVLWNIAGWIWTEDEIAAGRLPSSLDDLPFARHGTGDDEYKWWDPKHDEEASPDPNVTWVFDEDPARYEFPNTCRIRFSDGKEFDVPPLPEGYDSFRVLPYGNGPGIHELAYFWYESGAASMGGWDSYPHYGPDGLSDLYWIVAERTTPKPGDRVRVTDSDGPGEPYEFESTVLGVGAETGYITVEDSAMGYRPDQVTLLP